jgi:hypothetical protein
VCCSRVDAGEPVGKTGFFNLANSDPDWKFHTHLIKCKHSSFIEAMLFM